MGRHVITKGLDLPIAGEPNQDTIRTVASQHVAVVGHDYPLMKPRMSVSVGDTVKRGTLLFEDRKSEGVRFTAPGAGEVVAVNRGEKRVFQSLVIKLSQGELDGTPESETFESYKNGSIEGLSRDDVVALLAESGMWTSLRMRPQSRIPSTNESCEALFVTATDSNPLAASVPVTLKGREDAFKAGLKAVQKLTEGTTFVCVGEEWELDLSDVSGIQVETFAGKHPAGLVGTHIHTLFPVSRKRTAWHLNAQDVASIGHLFLTGELDLKRVISVAGPVVAQPGLVETRVGAEIAPITEGQLPEETEIRIISGSVFYGHKANEEAFGFLNRYDNQITVLKEDRERKFFGWVTPGWDRFSTVRAIFSAWLWDRKFPFTTTTHGSHRAMVPIGMFERVMPLDIMPTFLLRSILVGDLERAEELGALELHEEDLALCSFVSPGKEDYGKALRNVLTEIWQEG